MAVTNNTNPPTAYRKAKGEPVVLSTFDFSTGTAPWAKNLLLLIQRRLITICPQEVRARYAGEVDTSGWTISFRFRILGSNDVFNKSVTVPEVIRLQLSKSDYSRDIISYVEAVANEINSGLIRLSKLAKEDTTMTTKVTPKKNPPKKAVKCVLCGEEDPNLPPWTLDCPHTKKERQGK